MRIHLLDHKVIRLIQRKWKWGQLCSKGMSRTFINSDFKQIATAGTDVASDAILLL